MSLNDDIPGSVPVEISLNPISTSDGQFVLASSNDIIERKKAQERFQLVVEAAPNAMIMVGADGLMTLVNVQTEKLFGYARQELLGRPIEMLVPERFRSNHGGHRRGFFAAPATRPMGAGRDLFGLRQDGSEVPVEIGLNPISTPDGQFVLVSIIDITERKKAQERFQLVVEAAPNAMIMVGADGLMTLVNVQTEKLFGYDRQELLGRPIEMLVPERFRSNHGGHRGGFFAAPATRPMGAGRDLFGLRQDGSEVPVEIGLNPISTSDGQFVLASIIDITERKRAQERLALAESRFRRLLDACPVGIVETTWDGQVSRANDAFYRMIGWDRVSFARAGMDLRKITPEEWIELSDANRRAARENEPPALYEKEYWRRDGTRLPVVVGLSLNEAVPDDIIAVIVDLSEQKRAEQLLRENERQLRLQADAMPQIVWTARPDGYVDYYNQRWYEFTGLRPGAGGDDSWKHVLHPEDVQHCLDIWYSCVASGQPYETQYRFWDRKSKSWRWYLGRALPIRNEKGQVTKWVGTCIDIDDHKRLNEDLEQRVEQRTQDLRQSLVEKETLLKEVHHRVKNNLQVICSLLALQIESSRGSLSDAHLQNAYDRVQSMALIHERLYQSATLSDLDFGAYIEILTGQLLQAYCVDTEQIRLETSVEAVRLTIDQAIPCGLILNELISNSLKHAFRDGRRGIIRIFFAHVSPERLRLGVADNGTGLPATFALETAPSLGIQIVRTLAGQLGADLQIVRGEGTHIAIEWPLGGQ